MSARRPRACAALQDIGQAAAEFPGRRHIGLADGAVGVASTKANAEMKLSMPSSERRLPKSFTGRGNGDAAARAAAARFPFTPGP